jgi:salicylate 5-hydroxylase large subunit
MDSTGRHSALVSAGGGSENQEITRKLSSYRSDLKLHDPSLLNAKREFSGPATVVMQTLWPSLIVQQQSNTLATRQIVPRGPSSHDLHWTFFGYEDDSDEVTEMRLRQANLMGPAGLVSVDDGEVMRFSQDGASLDPSRSAVVEMGGSGTDDQDQMVTEVAIRAFYAHYREVMGL